MIPEFLFIAAALVVALASFAVLRQDKSAFASNLRSRIEALHVHLKQRESLLEGSAKLWARYEALKKGCDELTKHEQRLREDISVLEPRAGKIAEETAALNEEKSILLGQVRELEDEKIKWEDRIKELDRLDVVAAESLNKQKEIDEQILAAGNRLKELSTQLDEAESAGAKLTQLKMELAEATEKKATLDQEMEALKIEREEIELSVETSRKELEDLERSKKMLESIQVVAEGGSGGDSRGSVLSRKTFATLFEPEFQPSETTHHENIDKRLVKFYDHLQQHGYQFSNRLIAAFHTSLKVQDVSCLTVMAGISGTGKSALPRLYADFMGIHFLLVPVEPRWDSPQDLFGFLNYMENRYEATPMGRALSQFNLRDESDRKPMQDEMLMVLLDEMNLARVEYYFSEFLSRLEARREVAWQTDTAAYQKVSMEIFAGDQNEENERDNPIRLFAGPNVLFVGTMNEDESTQSLTDKVIDRSNAIHFGRPENLMSRSGRPIAASSKKISYAGWRESIAPGLHEGSASAGIVDEYLKRLNGVFDELGRPFGHRAYAATCAYIANHPMGLRDDITELSSLADQIAMRFLPKLRGLDLRENQTSLSRLDALLNELNDEAIRVAFKKASDEKNGYFQWRGIDWNL